MNKRRKKWPFIESNEIRKCPLIYGAFIFLLFCSVHFIEVSIFPSGTWENRIWNKPGVTSFKNKASQFI